MDFMIGNLGGYQRIVILAKKVGGPNRLLALVGVIGGVAWRLGEAGFKYLKRKRSRDPISNETKGAVFVVTSPGSSAGLSLNHGDQFRVLESHNDAILIERLGDDRNPYMVSSSFLRSVSNFPNTAL